MDLTGYEHMHSTVKSWEHISKWTKIVSHIHKMLQSRLPSFCSLASLLMKSHMTNVHYHFSITPVQPPPVSSLIPSSTFVCLWAERQDTSTWFIMCVSVRLASSVLLWLPPDVIQSSPPLNPTVKCQWFRPPWKISGLLSICHDKVCQHRMQRLLSIALWLKKSLFNKHVLH